MAKEEEFGRALREPALGPAAPEPASGLRPTGYDPARGEHGFCAQCGSNLNGGSIWQTGLAMAKAGALFCQRGQPAPSEAEAGRLADDYAESYGATRTRGQWGRELLAKPADIYHCPDCGHTWPAPWRAEQA